MPLTTMCVSCVSLLADYDEYGYLENLWKGQTDVVPVSSSLKCRLELTFPLHEWVDLFIGIAQAERLEEIKVTAEIIKVLLLNGSI